MFVELLDGQTIQGATVFRLHTMQFDPTMMRERIAARVFAAMHVPVPRVVHAEVQVAVSDQEPRSLGLYTAIEALDAGFLKRNQIPDTSLVMQTDGLNSIQYIGDEWTAYAPLFRATRVPDKQQQNRMIAFAKLIGDADDAEFDSKIETFISTEALLRYVAANSLTSNLTGFSSLGANDFLCLDSTGMIHVVASEMEVALGGSV